MDTPKRCGGWFLALVLTGTALWSAVAAKAEVPPPLMIEAQVGDIWVRVLGTDRKHLLGGDAASPREIPDTAPLRLVGDLVSNTSFLDTAATFDVASVAQPSASTLPPGFEARDISLPYYHPLTGSTTESLWQPTQPEKAVLVCIWQVDGQPTHLRILKLIQTGKNRFGMNRFTLPLAAGEARGNPVLLLLADGAALPKRPRWNNPAADRAAVLAALGQDALAANLVQQPGVLPKPTQDEPQLLHLCAQAGATETVASLLRLGVPLSVNDEQHNTALDLAARSGRTAIVAQLLAAKAPLSGSGEYNSSALHLAAGNAQAEICRLLVEAGAPLEARNSFGQTPIVCALLGNNVPTVELLLAKKAQLSFAEDGMERALMMKAAQGQRELVHLLLERQARTNLIWHNQTALIAAAREGHLGVVEELLAAKADPNLANLTGVTPLLAASSRGRDLVVQRLITAGARPDLASKDGNTPLQGACFAGSAATVKVLLAAGADVERANNAKIRPLTYALASGSREAVELLLSAGAKVDPTGPRFDAELATALSMDAVPYLAAALQAGMPADYRTARGWPALQIATLSKADTCAALLRASGAKDTEDSSVPVVVAAAKLETRPQLLELRAPFDPRSPEESDLKGELVLVEAIIDKDGTAAFARATCQDCRLSQSAVQTVLRSRFSPAMKGGVPVATQVRIPVQFPDRTELTFDFQELDTMPRPVSQVPPRYPFVMKKNSITGSVTMRFVVAPDGSVQDVQVVAATTREFAASAVEAIRQWRFSPGIYGGKAVACRMQQTFPFLLH